MEVISDIGPLTPLINLKTLDLLDTRVTVFSPIESIDGLTNLI